MLFWIESIAGAAVPLIPSAIIFVACWRYARRLPSRSARLLLWGSGSLLVTSFVFQAAAPALEGFLFSALGPNARFDSALRLTNGAEGIVLLALGVLFAIGLLRVLHDAADAQVRLDSAVAQAPKQELKGEPT